MIRVLLVLGCFILGGKEALGQQRRLDAGLHHLRNSGPPEWAEFNGSPATQEYTLTFKARANTTAQTLQVRQQDVKQTWQVLLNDQLLGVLVTDENDMHTYLNVPAGGFKTGENTLRIKAAPNSLPDDIRVGQISLDSHPVQQVLAEAQVSLEVTDGRSQELLPARITVTGPGGVLPPVGASTGGQLAVRTGVVYTGNGRAAFGLPAGTYRIYAGRGFEYGLDSVDLVLKPGDRVQKKLIINREVPTTGWISSDTHVHTFTYSGHGDATAAERVLTLAGEGIELPIVTDHNVQVDLRPVTKELGVSAYFTPVIGNEVTTPVGHFNIFPVTAGAPVPDHRVKDWQSLSGNLAQTSGAMAVILNHARDIHVGFRPFDPKQHLAPVGRSLKGWPFPANAMEVINSGATQTDNFQLYRDWFGMLNGGQQLTPVGSSDSHDVSRYVVGQGRTYIRCPDTNPGQLNTAEAIRNFREGKVMVSFGLLAEMTVNDQYGPGDLAPAAGEVQVAVRVLGPAWTRATRVSLYANGQKIKEAAMTDPGAAGVKWSGTWTLPRPRHDVFLVAIAEGPAGRMPYWPVAKPYQPTSTQWQPLVIGSSGAAWLDGDQDGKRSSAHDYAGQLLKNSRGRLTRGRLNKLVKNLAAYDEAVAVQVAAELQQQGQDLASPGITKALQKATPATKAGFARFREAWQAAQTARQGP